MKKLFASVIPSKAYVFAYSCLMQVWATVMFIVSPRQCIAAVDASQNQFNGMIDIAYPMYGNKNDLALEATRIQLISRSNSDCVSPNKWLAHTFSVLGKRARVTVGDICARQIVQNATPRIQRAARSVRSSVRQTFAARKAAKSADSGGGSSDPDGRRPHTETNTSNTCNTFSAVSAFLSGGAK